MTMYTGFKQITIGFDNALPRTSQLHFLFHIRVIQNFLASWRTTNQAIT